MDPSIFSQYFWLPYQSCCVRCVKWHHQVAKGRTTFNHNHHSSDRSHLNWNDIDCISTTSPSGQSGQWSEHLVLELRSSERSPLCSDLQCVALGLSTEAESVEEGKAGSQLYNWEVVGSIPSWAIRQHRRSSLPTRFTVWPINGLVHLNWAKFYTVETVGLWPLTSMGVVVVWVIHFRCAWVTAAACWCWCMFSPAAPIQATLTLTSTASSSRDRTVSTQTTWNPSRGRTRPATPTWCKAMRTPTTRPADVQTNSASGLSQGSQTSLNSLESTTQKGLMM